MTDPKPAPVCARCDDTHTVHLEDRSQMCTACPVPCSECRQGGNGPYCTTTPCTCACHAKQVTPGDLKVAGKDVAAVWINDGRGWVAPHDLVAEVVRLRAEVTRAHAAHDADSLVALEAAAQARAGIAELEGETAELLQQHYLDLRNRKKDAERIAELEEALGRDVVGSAAQLLEWAADRMVNVYGEHAGTDFVLAMRKRAALCREAMAKPQAPPVRPFIARAVDLFDSYRRSGFVSPHPAVDVTEAFQLDLETRLPAPQVHAFIARQPDQSPVECSKCRKPSVLVDGEYRCPNNPECGV